MKIVIVGIGPDGKLAFGGSFSDLSVMNWLLDAAKQHLLDQNKFA